MFITMFYYGMYYVFTRFMYYVSHCDFYDFPLDPPANPRARMPECYVVKNIVKT